ncbi:hypothetical protein [Leptolyngbya sp. Heron Island J]|uniref:hypothetical protein n=1 Tax=Leptolyngbya sp. Heron Island J TaxID=1385935 RepID=UPI0004035A4C|nr:hypothetical protein [Leptolyngbya sp. Heron Island J]
MLLDIVEKTIKQSQSPLTFMTEGNNWDRYLAIDGKKAFHIGNVCGTCEFFFERMEGAIKSINPRDVADELNSGINALHPGFLSSLEKIIPMGEYRVLLLRIAPILVTPGDKNDYFTHEQVSLWGVDGFWGMPHFPKTEYYRLEKRILSDGQGIFEFLIPTFPHNWLDYKQVEEYASKFQQNKQPTAVALSILDIKGPATWEGEPEIWEHLCLAHYLIDGHHKVYAAANAGKKLTLVSFLAVNQGVASKEDIEKFLTTLRKI